MKSPIFFSLIVLCLCLVEAVSISARDLNFRNIYKDSLNQNQGRAVTSSPNQINWPTYIGFQQTGNINASYNSFGQFGSSFAPDYPLVWPGEGNVPSFVTPADSGAEYLYAGAVWIGGILGDDTLVSPGLDGWQFAFEFYPANYGTSDSKGTTDKVDYIADFSLRTEFTDTTQAVYSFAWPDPSHKPLNLKISNRSHAWHTYPQNKTIIYDMVITNVGDEPIFDGYAGFYFDADVWAGQGSYIDDLTGSFRNRGIGYIIDNDGDFGAVSPLAGRIFAFKFLNNSFSAKDTSFNWWTSGSPEIDFGPRQKGTLSNPFRDFGTGGLGTPMGDANKYYVLRFPEWDYDQIQTYSIANNDPIWLEPNPAIDADFSDGTDARMLMSLGPFNLLPDSSIRILYSTFTGEFVHTTGASINYLPHDPSTYLSLLYFDDVFATANRADSLANLILDPALPPIGLQIVKKPSDLFDLQWDPWVYDDVTGYNLYISEPNLNLLPHPGAIPPWWMPDTTSAPIQTGLTYKLGIDSLDHNKLYLAAIAHNLGSERGQFSTPINFKLNQDVLAPPIPSRYAFAHPGGPLSLKWNLPADKNAIDHFNIYKFANKTSAMNAYHPQYDEGYLAQFFQPKDSFLFGDKTYYFYAMQPYAVANADDTVFFDSDVADGEAYIIASADQFGFESEFTEPILANVVDEMTRDILLITNSAVVTPNNFTFIDSVYSFYGRVLHDYDYEIYSHRDSTNITNCPSQSVNCMDWHDFMKFKMVIVDDHYSESFFANQYQDATDGFVRYLGHGGKLAYFGRFRGYGIQYVNGTLNYLPINHEFVNYFLGIDSLKYGGERYYHNFTSPPYFDTLYGFIRGMPYDDILPLLDVDTLRDPFTPRLRPYWEHKTPPGVATFKINNLADTSMLFESAYPLTSEQQNHVVGVRRNFPGANTYAYTFGFHLWYMDSVDALNLIRSIFNDAPSALFAQSLIEPAQFFSLDIQAPDSPYAYIHLGNLAHNRSVYDIDPASLLINNSVTPVSVEILPSDPGFNGDVLKIGILAHDLLSSYSVVWDTLHSTFTVDGKLTDSLSFQAAGPITIIGRLRGDIDGDAAVTVLDLTIMIDYIFRGQPLMGSRDAADADGNGRINILDLTKLVDYIFRGGDL